MKTETGTGQAPAPQRQMDLHLEDLRTVFRTVDRLATKRMNDRDIFLAVRSATPHFQDIFIRWLVRHTLHPEAEDDIMSDEIASIQPTELPGGTEGLVVRFQRVPPTVGPYLLVQYRNQFWHVVDGPDEDKRAVLRPLASLPE